jgi:serine/threonine protein kinase
MNRPGQRVMGKYRIIARLGEGGMAQVHLALMQSALGFNKLVVLKSMRDHLADPIFVSSFLHEARIAAQLTHPNVVQTYDVGEHDGRPYIAMEFVDGQALRVVQRRLAPHRLPLRMMLRVLADIARGLHHAHTLKSLDGQPLEIVHRDVSPQNVMITYDGQVKLFDFGIAKAQGSGELTRDGMIKGKIDYMPPEQLRGEHVDARSDVFPLGVMLWEAVTGKRFSGGAEVAEVTKIHNRLMAREPRLRAIAPERPMRLVEICDRAISVDPNGRQASAQQFADEITAYLADTSQTSEHRDISNVVAPLFEKERATLRRLIDEQVRLANSGDVGADTVESLELPVLRMSESSTRMPRSSEGFLRSEVVTAPANQRTRAPLFRRSMLVVIALAVPIGAAIALEPWHAEFNASAPATPAAQVPASTAVHVPAPAARLTHPAVPSVSIRVRANVLGAIAALDDIPIDLPFSGNLASDGRLHKLRVEAQGYQSYERALLFERDVDMVVTLERSAPEPQPTEEATRMPRIARGRRVIRRSGGAQAQTTDGAETAAQAAPAAPAAEASEAPSTLPPASRLPTIVQDDPYR